MSQRPSGYGRKPLDGYPTPSWVTAALVPHIPDLDKRRLWEPARGKGQMLRELQKHCPDTHGSDIETGTDFLQQTNQLRANAVISNPPYTLAREFIEHAIHLTQETAGLVAMLLRTDYDHAATRQHLFSGCPIFAKKLVLTKRIVWFDGPKAAPSFNHAWYVWNHTHRGPPTLAYGPT
jgi:hypothetical protein